MVRVTNRFLSKLCTVSDASFCKMDVQIQVFFWSNKTAYRISFFDFRAALKTLRCGASIAVPLACLASALPSELHPRWGNWGANAISKLSSVNAIVEQSFLLHIVVKLAVSMRVINPSVSHMPTACPLGWHASLVGSNGAVYVRGMSLFTYQWSNVSFDVFGR